MAQNLESNFHYFQNTQTYNAAYAGIKNAPEINTNFLRYKVGVDLFTNLTEAGFHTQLNKKPIGLGLSFKRNVFGSRRVNDYAVQFAYHFQLQEKIKLSAGLQLSLQHVNLNLSNIFLNNDLEIINDYFLNVNLGAILYSYKYYIGISLNNLVNQRLNKQGFFEFGLDKALYLSGGILFNEHSNFAVRPSVLLNLNFRSIDFRISEPLLYTGFLDLSVDALLYKTLWLGATFRPKQPLKLQAKVDIKQQISLLGYWQPLKTIPSLEKNYFFGLGLQARLSKIDVDVQPPSYF